MMLMPFASVLTMSLYLVPNVAAGNGISSGGMAPQVIIISMWAPESRIWHERFHESSLGNLTSSSFAIPGLSMLYPQVHCTQDGRVCQLTVGEGEINSAATAMALVLAGLFDLRRTYFLLAGIAGVNPRHATLGSVALARYSVQVALQYEIDSRSLPPDWPTGYISYGRRLPLTYPCITYGTEVFELNAKLQRIAFTLASRANLTDGIGPRCYRSRYASSRYRYAMATRPPTVVACDSATSDVYYSGTRLAQAFENITALWTNGSGIYCMSAQEDSAVLEVMVRAAIGGLVDFARILVLRAGSNFDRPPPGLSDLQHLTHTDQNGFQIAIDNMYRAGIEIVKGIVADWNSSFYHGIAPTNYIGDIWGSLGGHPDFGLGSITGGRRVLPGNSGANLSQVEMDRRHRFGPRTVVRQ